MLTEMQRTDIELAPVEAEGRSYMYCRSSGNDSFPSGRLGLWPLTDLLQRVAKCGLIETSRSNTVFGIRHWGNWGKREEKMDRLFIDKASAAVLAAPEMCVIECWKPKCAV